ncbi:hypothetical protein [Sphingopyxis panaciterrae]
MTMMGYVPAFSIPDNDARIRIAATIGAVGPCTPIERAARAVAACDDIEIDGSKRGELLFGRRADGYNQQARAAIETLRTGKSDLAPGALETYRRLRDAGASEIEIIEACFGTIINAVLAE